MMPVAEVQAGPELDAEIARRVFGWKIDTDATAGTATGEPWWRVPGERYLQTGVPEYSTQIAAAWLVVEKMREMDVSIMLTSPWDTEDAWVIEIWKKYEDDAENLGEVTADTAPSAICRAAFAALE